MTRLETLLKRLADAERAVLEELTRSYPGGCAVRYRLRPGVEPQVGTVIGHVGGREGKVRVRLAPSRNGGEYETTLPARKIIERL